MSRFALLGLGAVLTLVAWPAGAAGDEPTDAQTAWIEKHAVSFDGVEAGRGLDDLAPLAAWIGDARIVALGESTHGSREIFQMKHRLLEFLATKMGFTIFSIEACMPEAYRLNDYVLHGRGDPKQLIRGMYFWTWSTEEVLAMVEWMREYNRSGKGRLEFTGFDMQTPDVAIANVESYVRETDPDGATEMLAPYAQVRRADQRQAANFCPAVASFPVERAAGKKIRLSGWIRTENVTGFATLWWRADGERPPALAFDNMAARAPRGTTPWTKHAIELDIPAETKNINFGVILSGGGTAWFDDLEIEIDGKTYEDAGRYDFGFEGETIRGFRLSVPGYRGRLVTDVARSGQASLRIERLPEPKGLDPRTAVTLAEKAFHDLEAKRQAYLEKSSDVAYAWALQNARVVLQCMQLRARRVLRDRSMAANVEWIAAQNPEARIVLWAHNGHIGRTVPAMGGYLAKRFEDDYVAMGFSTSRGRYRARGNSGGGLGSHDLQVPPAGSVEALLSQTGKPYLLLDLRKAETSDGGSGWIREARPFRAIGAVAVANQFYPRRIAELFDLLVHIEKTSPAIPLKD